MDVFNLCTGRATHRQFLRYHTHSIADEAYLRLLWSATRFDDLLRVPPKSVVSEAAGLGLALRQAKIGVAAGAWISEPRWPLVGLVVWK